jgi:hypothetical protein
MTETTWVFMVAITMAPMTVPWSLPVPRRVLAVVCVDDALRLVVLAGHAMQGVR